MKELLQSRPPKDLGGENSDNRATITLADMHPDGNEIAGFAMPQRPARHWRESNYSDSGDSGSSGFNSQSLSGSCGISFSLPSRSFFRSSSSSNDNRSGDATFPYTLMRLVAKFIAVDVYFPSICRPS